MKRRVQVHGFIIFCALLVIIAFPKVFLRSGSLGLSEEVLSVVGLSCVLMGQIIRVSSRGFKSELSKSGSALVESGPYSLVRNPMYLGIILIGMGLVMMLFKWWVICLFLAIFSVIYIRLIFQEEKKLKGLFGEAFEAYRKKVPAIIPSFRVAAKVQISSYLPLKVAWMRREIGSICGVLVFVLIAKSCENLSAGYAIPAIISAARFIIRITMIFLSANLVAYLIRKTNACKKSF